MPEEPQPKSYLKIPVPSLAPLFSPLPQRPPCLCELCANSYPFFVFLTYQQKIPGTNLRGSNRKKTTIFPLYNSRLPSIAFNIVTSSAYSRSAPTGIPTPIRVTRTPSGFSSFDT